MSTERSGGPGASETWYSPTRRRDILVGTGSAALLAAIAVWQLFLPGSAVRPLFALLFGANAVWLAYLAWEASTHRVVADEEGLHVLRGRKSITFRWTDVVEVRPMALRSRRTTLVVVRRNGPIASLPIGEEHLDAVRAWQRRAG